VHGPGSPIGASEGIPARALSGPWLAMVLASVALLWLLRELAPWSGPGCLILLALIALVSLSRRLPLQNVIMVAVVVGLLTGAAHGLADLSNPAFAEGTGGAGWGDFWAEPLAWLVAIVAARGAARRFLAPSRQAPTYGFRMLGLSSLLVVLGEAGLGMMAGRSSSIWRWSLGAAWPVTAWTHPLAVALFTLLLLVAATPWLIDKKPAVTIPRRDPLANAPASPLASPLSLLPPAPGCKKGA